MKRLLALLFCACLLLGLTACGSRKNTEIVSDGKTYLVTTQKTMRSQDVTSTASFTYDEKGRPQLVEVTASERYSFAVEFAYDSHGNKIAEIYTDVRNGNITRHETHYDMTYAGDKLVHCDLTSSRGSQETTMGFDLSYDAAGRLTLLTYDEAYTASQQRIWHSFDYDTNGRLIRETQCRLIPSNSLDNPYGTYAVTQCRYDYNTDGSVMLFSMHTAEATDPVTPDNLDGLNFQPTPDLYSFCYNETGKLIYSGSGPEDVYQDGDETIYDDDSYTFDKLGNLLSTVQNGTGNTYGYTGFQLTEQEAATAKRLLHSVSESLSTYILYARLDPVYCEVGPILLYAPLLQNPVSYLVPYPMWGTP